MEHDCGHILIKRDSGSILKGNLGYPIASALLQRFAGDILKPDDFPVVDRELLTPLGREKYKLGYPDLDSLLEDVFDLLVLVRERLIESYSPLRICGISGCILEHERYFFFRDTRDRVEIFIPVTTKEHDLVSGCGSEDARYLVHKVLIADREGLSRCESGEVESLQDLVLVKQVLGYFQCGFCLFL